MKYRGIEANGVPLHFVEGGEGPGVIFATAFRRFGRVVVLEGSDGGSNERGLYGQ
jgi:hypothetical protein